MTSVVTYTEFDPQAIHFSPLFKTKNDRKMVYVNKSATDRTKLMITTPTMSLPFGLSSYTDKKTGDVMSYSLDPSFQGIDTDRELAMFYDKITKLDDRLVQVAADNSKDWFGKKMTTEGASLLTKPRIVQPKDAQYAPLLKINVSMTPEGMPDLMAYDEHRKPMPLENVTKGSRVKIIFQVCPVWFMGSQFGIKLKAVQMQVVHRNVEVGSECAFGEAVEESNAITESNAIAEDDNADDTFEKDENNPAVF